jgi:hypothetical protein
MTRVMLLTIALALTLMADKGFAGNIRRFTDGNGTLHISNVGPETNPEIPEKPRGPGMPGIIPGNPAPIPPAMGPAPGAAQSAPDQAPVPAIPKGPAPESGSQVIRSPSADEMILAGHQAAWELGLRTVWDEKPPLIQEASNQLWFPGSETSGTILSFTDRRGVIHIASRPAGTIQPHLQLAAGPEPEVCLPGPNLPTLQRVLGPGPLEPLAGLLRAITPGSLSLLPGNTIRRYRDHQGRWRITNSGPEITPIPAAPWAYTANVSGNPVAQAQPNLGLLPATAWAQEVSRQGLGASHQTIIARRDQRGTGRIFNLAVADLSGDRESPVSFLGNLPPDLEPIIFEAAQMYRLPVPLILALIRNESNFVPRAISPKGAMGLMQLMPGTAASLGVQDPFSPRENILGGCRYFRLMLDYFQGSVPLALAAYNAGFQRVIDAGYQIPPIKETQGFVTQVMALYYLLDKMSAMAL